MVLDLQRPDPGDKSVISRVARHLRVGEGSLRVWVKQSQVGAGKRPGLTTEERDELIWPRKKNFELQRVNDPHNDTVHSHKTTSILWKLDAVRLKFTVSGRVAHLHFTGLLEWTGP